MANGRICLFADHAEVEVYEPVLDKKGCNRQIISMFQAKYEKEYKKRKMELNIEREERARREEKERQEESERQKEKGKKEKEKPKRRLKMAKPNPNETPQAVPETSKSLLSKNFANIYNKEATVSQEKNSSPQAPSNHTKRSREETDDDNDDEKSYSEHSVTLPPKKIARKARNGADAVLPLSQAPGSLRDPPCDTCIRKNKDCYNQPGDLADEPVCLGCKRAKVGCSHVAKKKAEKANEKGRQKMMEAGVKSKARKTKAKTKTRASSEQTPATIDGVSDDDDNDTVFTPSSPVVKDKATENGLMLLEGRLDRQMLTEKGPDRDVHMSDDVRTTLLKKITMSGVEEGIGTLNLKEMAAGGVGESVSKVNSAFSEEIRNVLQFQEKMQLNILGYLANMERQILSLFKEWQNTNAND